MAARRAGSRPHGYIGEYYRDYSDVKRWGLLVGAASLAICLAWWVSEVATLDSGSRSEASSYGQFVLAVIGLLIIAGQGLRKTLEIPDASDLDALVDQVAVAVRREWQATAIERKLVVPTPLPVRWSRAIQPADSHGASATLGPETGFLPLPGLRRVTTGRVRSGSRRALHSVYGGLTSGRLIIIGDAGIGKTSVAVLLLLDALRFRDQAANHAERRRVPVPVMFSLSGWQPSQDTLEDWLVRNLGTMQMFRGRVGARHARAALSDGRLAVFLDGFDEVQEKWRSNLLRVLSDQATFRLVLLSRRPELIDAASRANLIGAVAVELQPLQPEAVADYLRHGLAQPVTTAWQRVIDELRTHPEGTLAEAFSTPLAVTLVRDIYSEQPSPGLAKIDELLDPNGYPTPDAVTDHLLDFAVAAAYSVRPGRRKPRYSIDVAERTLTHVAARLASSQDITWWSIPTWAPKLPRAIIVGCMVGTTTAVVASVAVGFVPSLITALVFGVSSGIGFGLDGPREPLRIANSVRRLKDPSHLAGMTALTVLCGLAAHLGIRTLVDPVAAVAAGLTVGILAGPAGWILIDQSLTAARPDPTDPGPLGPLGPVSSWRCDFLIATAAGCAFGLASGILLALIGKGSFPLTWAIVFSAVFGAVGSLLGLSQAGNLAIAQLFLSARYRTPLRLLHFLEDARSRQLLRTIGPVYQFRHALLQDRLAKKGCPDQRHQTISPLLTIGPLTDRSAAHRIVTPPGLELDKRRRPAFGAWRSMLPDERPQFDNLDPKSGSWRRSLV